MFMVISSSSGEFVALITCTKAEVNALVFSHLEQAVPLCTGNKPQASHT